MEIAFGVVRLVRGATDTGLEIRKLRELWKDAPRDVHHLGDELDTYEAFSRALRSGIAEWPQEGLGTATIGELGRLLSRSNGNLERLQTILQELVRGKDGSSTSLCGGSGVEGMDSLPRRRKVLWLRRVDEVRKLRKMLRQSTRDIGLFLTLLNV